MSFHVMTALREGLPAPEEGLVNEVKFVGDETLADQAAALLEATCWPDGQYPAGRIHSIYFDSPGRTALAEKLDGDNLKQKVRIRWYERPAGDPAPELPAFIEVKQRRGSARRKDRIRVAAPARWIAQTPLEDPELPAFLFRHAGALGTGLPLHRLPVVCISYDRRRYVCPQTGSRIALDRGIVANRYNRALFPGVAPVRLDRAVCELKNRAKPLPTWSEALYRAGFRLRSFSKFGECLNQILIGGAPHG